MMKSITDLRGRYWWVVGAPRQSFRLLVMLILMQVTLPAVHAQAEDTASGSRYYAFYKGYIGSNTFWRQVASMGNGPVKNGLAIWNTSGTYGPGLVSETMSYALILAALYDDQVTFDRLSATVQAGLRNSSTGLFPWYWTEKENNSFLMADTNSASDADVNIALAYVYADLATDAEGYGWTDPQSKYKSMATAYIKAIRKYDFSGYNSGNRRQPNGYILADGYKQAISTFSENSWHPDYSDLRAYQLFQLYDSSNTSF